MVTVRCIIRLALIVETISLALWILRSRGHSEAEQRFDVSGVSGKDPTRSFTEIAEYLPAQL